MTTTSANTGAIGHDNDGAIPRTKTITDVYLAFLHSARHIKRGQMRGSTQITLTTGDYCELLTVLADLKDRAAGAA
jgi:hypothetical protein